MFSCLVKGPQRGWECFGFMEFSEPSFFSLMGKLGKMGSELWEVASPPSLTQTAKGIFSPGMGFFLAAVHPFFPFLLFPGFWVAGSGWKCPCGVFWELLRLSWESCKDSGFDSHHVLTNIPIPGCRAAVFPKKTEIQLS